MAAKPLYFKTPKTLSLLILSFLFSPVCVAAENLAPISGTNNKLFEDNFCPSEPENSCFTGSSASDLARTWDCFTKNSGYEQECLSNITKFLDSSLAFIERFPMITADIESCIQALKAGIDFMKLSENVNDLDSETSAFQNALISVSKYFNEDKACSRHASFIVGWVFSRHTYHSYPSSYYQFYEDSLMFERMHQLSVDAERTFLFRFVPFEHDFNEQSRRGLAGILTQYEETLFISYHGSEDCHDYCADLFGKLEDANRLLDLKGKIYAGFQKDFISSAPDLIKKLNCSPSVKTILPFYRRFPKTPPRAYRLQRTPPM